MNEIVSSGIIYYTDKNGASQVVYLNPIPLNSIYEEIGKYFLEMLVPSVMDVSVVIHGETYHITYSAKQRGSYVKNGVEEPSMFVSAGRDEVLKAFGSELDFSNLKECYLTCVNPESNNYKFYHMTPTTKGIEVEYGRIGAVAGEMFGRRTVQTPYHPSLYWVRYYEKLGKGYVDNSKAYLTTTEEKPAASKKKKEKVVDNGVSEAERSLYNILFAYSKSYINHHLVSEKVTAGQVKEAKRIFKNLCNRKSVKGFNEQLLKLMQLSPRRVTDVSSLMAHTENDFSSIIEKEENLILSMEAMVSNGEQTIEESFKGDIEVYEATDKQKAEVMAHLSDSLKSHVDKIYRVIPKKQQERFNAYVKTNNITKIKQLWHGSVNSNWLSIIENGLSLSAGMAHGRMFGNGIYFAPSSMKSWGYTSYHGTYWAGGKDSVAFMGLYATAYGKPVDVQSSQYFSEAELKKRNANCVHAHAGISLRNDEIVYYNEGAVVLNYIVKFK